MSRHAGYLPARADDVPDVVAGESAGAGRALEGFRIGVTSDRRAADLIDALARRGASVLHAPLLRIAPVAEDTELVAETRAVIEAVPDYLLVTTAYGMRRWVDAADANGFGEDLADVLGSTRIHVRGPKARGAVRAAGFTDEAISSDELTSTLVDGAITAGVRGATVAVQMHGHADHEATRRLRDAGARVLTVSPYRWETPPGSREVTDRLIDAACTGGLDVLTFTSAPSVDALFSAAQERGRYPELLEALQTTLAAATVGPVTAQPLLEAGVEPLVPERYRMGAMIRQIVEYLSDQAVDAVDTSCGQLFVRGSVVELKGHRTELSAAQLVLFRALVRAGGAVLARDRLASLLPEGQGGHALDMAISRLRQALPDGRLVGTVVKRGYRLNV